MVLSNAPTIGNLMICVLAWNNSTGATETMTAPSGWTTIEGSAILGTGSGQNLYAFYRIAQTGDGTNYTFKQTGSTSGFVTAILSEMQCSSGWASTAVNASATNTIGTTAASTNMTSASATPTITNGFAFVAYGYAGVTGTPSQTVASGWTQIENFADTGTAQILVAYNATELTSTSAVSTTTQLAGATSGSSTSIMMILAPGSSSVNLTATDTAQTRSDSINITTGPYIIASDTAPARSDNPTFAPQKALSATDTAPTRSDNPMFQVAVFLTATDTAQPISDTPKLKSATALTAVDRAPVRSDTPRLTALTSGSGGLSATDTAPPRSDEEPFSVLSNSLIVRISAPAGCFNSDVLVQMPPGPNPDGSYNVPLADSVTGFTGSGTYEVNFALDPLTTYGIGSHSPALVCLLITAPSPYNPEVLKGWQFTVMGGQIIASRDNRVYGGVGVNNSVIPDYAAPIATGVTITSVGTILEGVSSVMRVSCTFTNVPQDGTVFNIAWYFRPSTSSTWTPWATTAITSGPNIPSTFTTSFDYAGLENGTDYDFGAAYASSNNATGPVGILGEAVAAPAIGVPAQYMLGGITIAPTFESAPILSSSGSLNGINADVQVEVTVNNQPTDGSLSRMSWWYRHSGTVAWAYYGSTPAVGVGDMPPPSNGSYTFNFADLTNNATAITSGGYDFAISFEDSQGGDSASSPSTSFTSGGTEGQTNQGMTFLGSDIPQLIAVGTAQSVAMPASILSNGPTILAASYATATPTGGIGTTLAITVEFGDWVAAPPPNWLDDVLINVVNSASGAPMEVPVPIAAASTWGPLQVFNVVVPPAATVNIGFSYISYTNQESAITFPVALQNINVGLLSGSQVIAGIDNINFISDSDMDYTGADGASAYWTYANFDPNRFRVRTSPLQVSAGDYLGFNNGGGANVFGCGYTTPINVGEGITYCFSTYYTLTGSGSFFGIVDMADKNANNVTPTHIYASGTLSATAPSTNERSYITWTATFTGLISCAFWCANAINGSWDHPQFEVGSTPSPYKSGADVTSENTLAQAALDPITLNTLVIAQSAVSSNLCVNPNFATPAIISTDIVAGWSAYSYFGYPNPNTVVLPENAGPPFSYSGTSDIVIRLQPNSVWAASAGVGTAGLFTGISMDQPITVAPGQNYRLTAFVRSDSSTNIGDFTGSANCYLHVVFSDGSSQYFYSNNIVTIPATGVYALLDTGIITIPTTNAAGATGNVPMSMIVSIQNSIINTNPAQVTVPAVDLLCDCRIDNAALVLCTTSSDAIFNGSDPLNPELSLVGIPNSAVTLTYGANQITASWPAFDIPLRNGETIPVPAGGSTANPNDVKITGLTPSTEYTVGQYATLKTNEFNTTFESMPPNTQVGLGLVIDLGTALTDAQVQTANGDGSTLIGVVTLTTLSSGSAGISPPGRRYT
jgi:hypothetical protein